MADSMERRTDYIRDFVAHVSHEFKTPLTTIRGTVELLKEHLDEMSAEERARFLGNLNVEAGRMTALVSRLLELARADVMRAKEGEVSNPSAILGPLRERYAGTGLRLAAEVPADIPLTIGEDALETILINLLDNTLHHAGPAPEVSVSLRRDGGMAVLTVADNGPGIAEANLDKVFDPFFTLTRNQGGTGLGLAIVRSLVTAYNGRVSALPSPSGALFRIELPAA
jgi:signal transduction histidine kinase